MSDTAPQHVVGRVRQFDIDKRTGRLRLNDSTKQVRFECLPGQVGLIVRAIRQSLQVDLWISDGVVRRISVKDR